MPIRFTPAYGDCQAVATSTSSANVTFTAGQPVLKIGNHSSTAAQHVFVKVGTTSQTATNNDLVISPLEVAYVGVSGEDDNIAHRAGASTPTINICPGHAQVFHTFSPIYDDCQLHTSSGTSSNLTFTAGTNTLKVSNHGAVGYVHVVVGPTSQTATTSDFVVGSLETVYIAISAEDDNIAVIAGSGTPDVSICPGHTVIGG